MRFLFSAVAPVTSVPSPMGIMPMQSVKVRDGPPDGGPSPAVLVAPEAPDAPDSSGFGCSGPIYLRTVAGVAWALASGMAPGTGGFGGSARGMRHGIGMANWKSIAMRFSPFSSAAQPCWP